MLFGFLAVSTFLRITLNVQIVADSNPHDPKLLANPVSTNYWNRIGFA